MLSFDVLIGGMQSNERAKIRCILVEKFPMILPNDFFNVILNSDKKKYLCSRKLYIRSLHIMYVDVPRKACFYDGLIKI